METPASDGELRCLCDWYSIAAGTSTTRKAPEQSSAIDDAERPAKSPRPSPPRKETRKVWWLSMRKPRESNTTSPARYNAQAETPDDLVGLSLRDAQVPPHNRRAQPTRRA